MDSDIDRFRRGMRHQKLRHLANEGSLGAAEQRELEQLELESLAELEELTVKTDAFREGMGYKKRPVAGEATPPQHAEGAKADDHALIPAPSLPDPAGTQAHLDEAPRPPSSAAVKWENVTIRFLSDERIQITTPTGTETLNYAEFGLENRTTKKGPRKAWVTLRDLARSEGHLPVPIARRSEIEKRIQELRALLRKRFKLQDDPFSCIKKGTAYRAKFVISAAKSFDS